MISIKNPDQIGKMREAGALLYEVLQKLRDAVKPGVSTAALDVYAEQLIRKHKAIPSFLDYQGYPASICVSVNDEIVHGIPSEERVLKDGDIVLLHDIHEATVQAALEFIPKLVEPKEKKISFSEFVEMIKRGKMKSIQGPINAVIIW